MEIPIPMNDIIRVYFMLQKVWKVIEICLIFGYLRILFAENKSNIDKVILDNVPDSKKDSRG